MTTSATLTIQISCPVEEAFAFLADPATMPQWAIHNVKSIKPLGDNEWEILTPRGPGRFIPHFDLTQGILDHEFIDPREGRWSVPARVVPAGPDTSVYLITLAKPATMPEEAFKQAMPLVVDELRALKSILERSR